MQGTLCVLIACLFKWRQKYKHRIVTHHASGVPWRIIRGSELDDWIYWHFYYNYNQFINLIIDYCVRLAPFLTELRVSSLLRDWLGSDLRVGHFFSFCCQLVNTPQLNTQLSCKWIIGLPHEWTKIDRSPSPTARVLLCFIRCRGTVCYRTFA
jgi:hypothetical protein